MYEKVDGNRSVIYHLITILLQSANLTPFNPRLMADWLHIHFFTILMYWCCLEDGSRLQTVTVPVLIFEATISNTIANSHNNFGHATVSSIFLWLQHNTPQATMSNCHFQSVIYLDSVQVTGFSSFEKSVVYIRVSHWDVLYRAANTEESWKQQKQPAHALEEH